MVSDAVLQLSDLVYPFERQELGSPSPIYDWLREHHPLARVRTAYGTDAWLVSGHKEVRAVLVDERFSAGTPTTAGIEAAEPEDDPAKALFNLDPPDHTRLRRVSAPFFTVSQVKSLRPRLERIADGLVDAMVDSGAPADLVQAYVHPLVSGTLWEVLEVSEDLLPAFRAWADELREIREPSWDPDPATNPVLINRIKLRRTMQALIAERRRNPGDDIVSKFLAARERGEIVDEPELIVQLTGMVLGGIEPTFNMMGLALLTTLSEPGLLRRMRDDPDTIGAAVEEMLRYHAPTDIGFVRVAKTDVEIFDAHIKKGDVLIVALASANRDATVIPDAHRLDVTRTENPHVAFGYGRHHCLGAHLARLEIGTALAVLARRLPGLRLAVPFESVPRRLALAQFGPEELTVTW
ncbi:p450 monooxygenase encR [Micromonospora sp. ATCC 39149]|uniref:Cytochrome P450 n=1 Tax=Micromonospora carbonacea TaxID=47853 RepID=A0A7D5Y9Q4_9ACTN|nr:cytochrome P450 [Micromonospora sp. ATCC 39149]EEP73622.1 p450 monooxygenase encR [Micromonospora sp. ATCC 39149]QLJ99539.1 cytochrome P450 [Micromonospora carbonacea]